MDNSLCVTVSKSKDLFRLILCCFNPFVTFSRTQVAHFIYKAIITNFEPHICTYLTVFQNFFFVVYRSPKILAVEEIRFLNLAKSSFILLSLNLKKIKFFYSTLKQSKKYLNSLTIWPLIKLFHYENVVITLGYRSLDTIIQVQCLKC